MVPLVRFWRPVVAALAMAPALCAIGDVPVVFQIGAEACAYALVLFLVGGWTLRGAKPELTV